MKPWVHSLTPKKQGRKDGNMDQRLKAFATKPNNSSSIFRIHIVERENMDYLKLSPDLLMHAYTLNK